MGVAASWLAGVGPFPQPLSPQARVSVPMLCMFGVGWFFVRETDLSLGGCGTASLVSTRLMPVGSS
jgi:hypothetical protein